MMVDSKSVEEAILGTIVTDKERMIESIQCGLNESWFSSTAHKHLFRAVLAIFGRGQTVDLITLAAELRQKGVLDTIGGEFFLMQISDKAVFSTPMSEHVFILRERWRERELLHLGVAIQQAVTEGSEELYDAERIIAHIGEKTLDLVSDNQQEFESIGSIGRAEVSRLMTASAKELSGVDPGLKAVRNMTGGWQPTDLIILAGRPGMGKTALALVFAEHAAASGTPVLFFSQEMSRVQLFQRLLSKKIDVSVKQMRMGLSDHEKGRLTNNSVDAIMGLPITINDTPAQNINIMRAQTRAKVLSQQVGLVIVDYLTLSTAGKDNPVRDVTAVAEGLKAMAKENNIPVIALAQLSRAVEMRGGDKKPILSDLRESGGIEQAADSVIFIYRPEYYGLTEYEGNPAAGLAVLDWAKHRNGDTGERHVTFIGRTTDFVDYEELDWPPAPKTAEQKELYDA